MVSEFQENRIREAIVAIDEKNPDFVTAGQIWRYLSKKYKWPGFKSRHSVAQCLSALRKRKTGRF